MSQTATHLPIPQDPFCSAWGCCRGQLPVLCRHFHIFSSDKSGRHSRDESITGILNKPTWTTRGCPEELPEPEQPPDSPGSRAAWDASTACLSAHQLSWSHTVGRRRINSHSAFGDGRCFIFGSSVSHITKLFIKTSSVCAAPPWLQSCTPTTESSSKP